MEPLNRRRFLAGASLASLAWLTPLGHLLARDEEKAKGKPAKSLILLWLQGGPSQLETFDPHPGKDIAYGTEAIKTSVKGVQFAKGLERTAEQMESLTIIRSMVSKEGDHERGTYTMKTGFRPDPTVVHPGLGAILCHELPEAGTDIPRHVSILPNQWSARGGFLGEQFDAFRTYDPSTPVPDTKSYMPPERESKRQAHLDILEKTFAKGRKSRAEATLHADTVARARKMMTSDQLKAFDVSHESAETRKLYGDTPFGRACLAARRLTEVGVRCVEVTLDGWDTHANNHASIATLLKTFDPAFAALIADLRKRKRLDDTLVLVAGEFGRTPKLNPAYGRDHWPEGFSVALAGANIAAGKVIGETDPDGKEKPKNPVRVADLTASILEAFAIDYTKINQTPIGRTVQFSEGRVVEGLLKS